jgi:transcriptional regulator with XRE-family HTH domain
MKRRQQEERIRPLQERIGEALRKRRKAKGFSQDGFADHIDMHRSYYGAIERGQKNLQLDTLERVCNGLEAPMSEILRDAESRS